MEEILEFSHQMCLLSELFYKVRIKELFDRLRVQHFLSSMRCILAIEHWPNLVEDQLFYNRHEPMKSNQ